MNMKRKAYSRILVLALGLSLACTGCGDKSAEEVTDYGAQKMTAGSAEQSSESGTGSQGSSEGGSETGSSEAKPAGQKMGELPAVQNGGTPLWQGSFNAKNVPVEVSITNLYRDVDTLHSYRMKDLSEDQVREAETVKAILGDTAKEVRRDISLKDGDAQYIIGVCQTCRLSFMNEQISEYGEGPVAAWVDDENYFYHTYEGTYMDVPYQMVIAYHRQGGEKSVSFYPKNPGDLVDSPKCNYIEPLENHFESINTDIWSGTNVWEAMSDRPNRTQSGEDTLISTAKTFSEEKLMSPMSTDDMKITIGKESGDQYKRELLFYSDDAVKSGTMEGAVLDGYEVQYNMCHAVTGEEDYSWMIGNSGFLWVTDKGVIGGSVNINYEVVEKLADQVQVLKFENLMECFEEVVKTDFDVSKVNGQKLTFSSATLMYYPVWSEEDAHEFTLVPCWGFEGYSNGRVATILINAVDGSKIVILYTN